MPAIDLDAIIEELRHRVKRLMVKPNSFTPYHLGPDLLMWWKENGEIGIGDASLKMFEPILVTQEDGTVTHCGTPEEVKAGMRVLQTHMLLDDLADDAKKKLESLSMLFEAEREAEAEIGRRGRAILDRNPMSTPCQVKVEWVCIENTLGTLYIFKETPHGLGVDNQELIYAEDLVTGRCVGRGAPMVMVEAIEILRRRMILDDLADV